MIDNLNRMVARGPKQSMLHVGMGARGIILYTLWTTHNLGRMVGQSSPCSACVGEGIGVYVCVC